ncbi:MAG: phosphatidate cytidylyltransferase [Clostridia bacterium]|nr:phosphatidate cytidylyltransferase [Clostridia bacterium]
MKQRVITGLIGIVIFFIVVYCLPVEAIVGIFAALCGFASYEAIHINKEMGKNKLYVAISALMGAFIPVAILYFDITTMLIMAAVYTAVMVIFAFSKKIKFNLGRVVESYVGVFGVTTLLSSVMKIFILSSEGKVLVLMPFAVAWCTDIFAQLCGIAFGKHKLCPKISPKKTVEGSVGGILGGVIGVFIISSLLSEAATIPVATLIFMGACGSVISQIGDLSMSLLKRLNGVKDFSNLFPGHGGVLDRFDSVMLAAPFVELVLRSLGIM